MHKYYVYATDDSASTYNDRKFNSAALITLQHFQDEVANADADAKVVYLHWSAYCKEQNYNSVRNRYEMRNGEGGDTRPSEFLKWVQKYVDLHQARLELLYMVTDGQIPQREIGRCQELLNKHSIHFKRVVFHAINSDEGAIDLSVASVVCAESDCEIYRNNQLCERVNLSVAFDYDGITSNNFAERQNELLAYVRHKFINAAPTDKAVLMEADKLKRLRRRLMDEMRTPAAHAVSFDNITTKSAFVYAFKNTPFYQTLYNGNALDRERVVDATISTAINYLHTANKSYAFDVMKQIHFQSQLDSATSEDDQVANEEIDFAPVEPVEFDDCILAHETGVPAIMITHVNLWDGVQGGMSRFKQQLDFPLLFMRNENLKQCIDYCYNLESLQQLMQHGSRLSPRTRRPFTGALVPDPHFDAYNDYVVASSFFAGKKAPYNAGLMYYLLYKLINAAEYIEPCVKDRFRTYALHRIRTTRCFIALSNLPMDPPLQVALPTAVWYVAEISTLLFASDRQHFAKERLRQYAGFADDMLTILQWYGLNDVDAARVRQRAHCLSLINKFKRMTKPEAARWVLKRAFEVRDGFCVNNLVNAQRLCDLKYLNVNPAGPVDDEAIANAPIPFDKYAIMYSHICDFEAQVVATTMRPPFVLGTKRTFYDALMESARTVRFDEQLNVVLEPYQTLSFDKIISINKLYIQCVEDIQQFPSKEEFIEYVQVKKNEQNGRVGVFPQNIKRNVVNVHAAYAKKIVNVSVQQFLKLANDSVNRRERIKLETQDDDNLRADKLIADAEKRVGLKRV